MKLSATIVLGLTLTATAASAQTTTTCSTVGRYLNCNTSAPPPTPSYSDGSTEFGDGIAALVAARQRRREAKRLNDMAGELTVQAIEAGDCNRAKAIVVQFGDASDLEMVDRACVPAGMPITPSRNNYRPEVDALIKQRRCEDARQLARLNRDTELAEQVRATCVAKR